MTIQELGSLGELLGSILVLVTLLYLARQIGQAKRAMLLSEVQAQSSEVQTHFRFLVDSPHASPIMAKASAGDPLDPVENERAAHLIALIWSLVYSTWVLRELSDADELLARADIHLALLVRTFGNRAQEWIGVAGRHIYPPRFIEWAESVFAELPASGRVEAVDGLYKGS